ncbi:MAG: DNA polymerase Y family protein [Deltaproteobacteria bacterium]|nr:DNA polymerase Y family protein [Deltaproteobacteria bacterium]
MIRTACIWIPRFELAARLRESPELRGQPVILADAAATRARVLEATPEAEAAGLQPGLSMVTARALCPEAVIVPPDAAFLRAARKEVLAALYAFAEGVGRDEQGAFFLSLAGCERLHPDEKVLGEKLARTVRALGYEGRVAIAGSALAAWSVARAGAEGAPATVIPPGEDRASLAALPLEALPMPEGMARLLGLLGIEAVGGLERLPPGALALRFGKAGLELEEQARGSTTSRFRVEEPVQVEEVLQELDEPLEELEALLFVGKSVLDRLLTQVARSRRVVVTLELTLRLAIYSRRSHEAHEPHEGHAGAGLPELTHRLRPARPTLNSRTLLELLRLWLSSQELPAPVAAFGLRAVEVGCASARQLDLFARQQEHDREALATICSRLVATFGREAVVRPRLVERHLPEARLSWMPLEGTELASLASPRRAWQEERPAAAPAAFPVLCLIEPPRPVTFEGARIDLSSVAEEGPARAARGRHLQRVVAREGPYRLQGEWWATGFEREYWLVRTAEGAVLWLFRSQGEWHVQAYVD